MPKRKTYIGEDGEVAELDPEFIRTAKRGRPPMLEKDRKQRITIMLDRDIIEHFKEDGPGWQTRLNAALRDAIDR